MGRIIRQFISLLILAGLATTALANDSDPYFDQPQPEESFRHFFRRITHGGLFQGISLDAPPVFQQAFYKRIRRSSWMGPVNRQRQALADKGVDLWGELYRSPLALQVLFDSAEWKAQGEAAFRLAAQRFSRGATRTFSELIETPWSSWTLNDRRLWLYAAIIEPSLYGGHALIDHLADQYQVDSALVLSRSEFFLLGNSEFAAKVKEMGWDGAIYFRGITGPDPHDSSRRWIVLNDDLLRQMSPFDSPFLKLLEYPMILSHEFSHVFQDFRAEKLGINLTVSSAEGALLIEGSAEALAQSAWQAAIQSQHQLTPLGLFLAEQGVEIAFRPGQEEQGNLFPYTVGFPFAVSVFDLTPASETIHRVDQIIGVIAEKQSLQDFLFQIEKSPASLCRSYLMNSR